MIRVVIVGDIRLYRDGLAEILSKQPGLGVVGSFAAWQETNEVLATLRPDVVLLDMAGGGSYEAIVGIRELVPDARVVALGMVDVERDLLGCAEAGIAGYVTRDGSLDSLITAIQSAVLGELVCSPRIAGRMLRRLATLSAANPGGQNPDLLTAREREILRLIDQGCSNKEISSRLGIEVATVKNHVHNLLDKLQVHRRGEAAARVRTRAAHHRI